MLADWIAKILTIVAVTCLMAAPFAMANQWNGWALWLYPFALVGAWLVVVGYSRHLMRRSVVPETRKIFL
jgi:hypothetical protein